jgi:hypothetical protein
LLPNFLYFDPPAEAHAIKHTVIVPISGIHRDVVCALQYARSIASDKVQAVHVDLEEEAHCESEREVDPGPPYQPPEEFDQALESATASSGASMRVFSGMRRTIDPMVLMHCEVQIQERGAARRPLL